MSDVNEDRDIVLGRAVCRQEPPDRLHLVQNSYETNGINNSHQIVPHQKVVKALQTFMHSIFLFGLNDPSGALVVNSGPLDCTCLLVIYVLLSNIFLLS